MTRLIRGQELADFVLGYKKSAFRLEVRERYSEPEEVEPLRRFLAGEPDYAWNEEWATMMRRRTACGQRMERVRVVTEPHSEYTRFGLDLARVNVPVGEDIRYLPRDQAVRLDLPGYDFWLIDSSGVGILRFSEDDVLLGAEILHDPAVVDRHCRWRDVAWQHAVPFAEYDKLGVKFPAGTRDARSPAPRAAPRRPPDRAAARCRARLASEQGLQDRGWEADTVGGRHLGVGACVRPARADRRAAREPEDPRGAVRRVPPDVPRWPAGHTRSHRGDRERDHFPS